MSKSSVKRIGKGCSGCYFNIKITDELCGSNIIKHKHMCVLNDRKPRLLDTKFRMEDKLHSCFRSKY